MPGLVGIASSDRAVDEGLLARMAASIKHEDWYGMDSHCGPTFGAARVDLGIFNPGAQPVFNGDRTLLLFMYGKIYDRQALSDGLKDKGYATGNDSDPGLCLQLYEEYGERFVTRLNGSFVIVIYDLAHDKLLICNDRYALRPFYFAASASHMVFASEVKAILQADFVGKDLNDETIAEFLACGGEITGDKTFFSGVEALPPASILTYGDGGHSITQYWDYDYRPDYSIAADDYAEQLAESFRKAVNTRLETGFRHGLWLSGGLDSRLIASAMDRDKVNEVVAFTFGSPGCTEYRVAKRVAGLLDMKHVFMEYRAEESIPYAEKAVYVTDGFDHVGMGGNFEAFARIAQNVSVSFNGLPGDLSLGGSFVNRRIVAARDTEQLLALLDSRRTMSDDMMARLFSSSYFPRVKGVPSRLKREALEAAKPEHPGNKVDYFYLQNKVRRFSVKGDALARVFQEVASPFYDNDFVDLLLRTPPEYRRSHRLYLKVLNRLSPALAGVEYADKRVPANVPLIVWHLSYLLLGGEIVANRALGRVSGKQLWLINRHKNLDYVHWMRTNAAWRQFTEDLLLGRDSRSAQFLNREYVDLLIREHRGRRADHAFRLSLLMTFELFLRMFT